MIKAADFRVPAAAESIQGAVERRIDTAILAAYGKLREVQVDMRVRCIWPLEDIMAVIQRYEANGRIVKGDPRGLLRLTPTIEIPREP